MVKKVNQLLKPFKILLFLFFYCLDFELIKNNIQYLKKGFKNYILDNNIKVINNSDNNLTNIIIDNEFIVFEGNIDYSNYSTDIKTLALYLPQYHFIKENNIWWGENFTEWTNVKKTKPLYEGHHQPRKPGDEKDYLGYYLLTDSLTIKKQVHLAKSHGIYGFAFYYYWFSGKRLLEKPINIYLENKDIDFPFLLIWANENWSRNWDGGNRKILMKQEYKLNDPENFIKDIQIYLRDDRYIKINEKTVIGIYEPLKIPQLKKTLSIWRKEAKKIGIGELYILISLNSHKLSVFKRFNFLDAAYDFPPRNIIKFHDYYYSDLIYKNKNFINLTNEFPVFRGSMLEWDNTARRGNRSTVFREYSPEKFYLVNKIIIDYTRSHYNESNRFIFINAWNEWAEGSYLEPDDKYG
jgi:lipopolysaccharide biosynthesis protein